jgi:Ser/Thr protein kinase RdoA (MazF antagonist)
MVEEPVALRSTNNVLVWLRPSMVVAKISSRPGMAANELAIAKALAAAGAPVVPPADVVGDRLHDVSGRDVTFWKYEPQDEISSATARSIAVALFDLHGALATLGSVISLPNYEIQITDAIRSLDNQDFAPELRGEDRFLLRQALSSGKDDLAQLGDTRRIIHGSPHGMNTLVVAGEPRFIDFETVQVGPLEWDLAHLGPKVADHYPAPFDVHALAVCRLTVSATTSTWCWDGLERGPDMRTHAEHHLAVVRLGFA